MNTIKVVEESLRTRDLIKSNSDSPDNNVDINLKPVPPFKGTDNIILIIIGQDPTIKNEKQRKKITVTLNLDKGGSLKTYITEICDALGIKLTNVYATNIFKYFYTYPPASTMEVLYKHLDLNLNLLKEELKDNPNIPVITLGEPVLQLLSNIPGDKVRSYWDYKKGVSGHAFKKCIDNDIDRPFYPFPHQPSVGKQFYADNKEKYVSFVKKDSGI